MDEAFGTITLRKMLRALSDIAMPRKCVVCSRTLDLSEDHICLECLIDLPLTYFWTQDRNSMAIKYNERISGNIPDGVEESFANAVSLIYYGAESSYRAIPRALKYERGFAEGRYFSDMLAGRIAECAWAGSVDLVVPVPLHPRRRWERGYNQAEVIARRIAARLGVPLSKGCLKRTRNTVSQTGVAVELKAENVRGAFAVAKTPRASHILLVDDTFTTGSTLSACHAALRTAYPPSVRISVATLSFVGD